MRLSASTLSFGAVLLSLSISSVSAQVCKENERVGEYRCNEQGDCSICHPCEYDLVSRAGFTYCSVPCEAGEGLYDFDEYGSFNGNGNFDANNARPDSTVRGSMHLAQRVLMAKPRTLDPRVLAIADAPWTLRLSRAIPVPATKIFLISA